jgi:alkanesulfonate monooxygenase
LHRKLRDIVDIFVIAPRPAQPTDHWRETHSLIEMADACDVTGVLIFTGNDMPFEPFVLAQTILERTESLLPLVAVNPIYQHPFSVARMVNSLHALYGRTIHLNLVTGVSVRHLESLGEQLDHEQRYGRLTEFALVVRSLLRPHGVTTFDGQFYQMLGAQLAMRIPETAEPKFLIAGESSASRRCASAVGAVRIAMLGAQSPEGEPPPAGVHFGIVAREDSMAALDAARRIFADDGSGAEMHNISLEFSDSKWKHRLAKESASATTETSNWMVPFRTGRADCPYVVGSHDEIAETLARLTREGRTTFILDIPPFPEDFTNLKIVLNRAARLLEPGGLSL